MSKPCDCSSCDTACLLYDGSGTTWPRQGFPATAFLQRYSASSLRESRAAWETFERIESLDAQVRVCLSGTPAWNSPTAGKIWYKFRDNAEYIAYTTGRQLHIELCPGYSWKPQRNLGLSPTAVTDVYPSCCA